MSDSNRINKGNEMKEIVGRNANLGKTGMSSVATTAMYFYRPQQ